MSCFRIIRLPRVGFYLPAEFHEDSQHIFVVPRFVRFEDIWHLAKSLDNAGFDNAFPIYTNKGVEVEDSNHPPVAPWYNFIAQFDGRTEDVIAIWDAGDDIDDEDYPIYQTLAQVIR